MLSGTHRTVPTCALVGLLLAGWGLFNVVEGLIDHHLLEVHHVRDDVADPLPWDLGSCVLVWRSSPPASSVDKSAENPRANLSNAATHQ